MSICKLWVDLAAINSNLRLAAELAQGRQVLAAVKANAYGHGLVEVARSIEAAGSAQWLGVARVSEASQLRAAGVKLPILKFSTSLPEELAAGLAAGMSFTVADAAGAQQLAKAAAAAGQRAKVQLKVDTGMRRLGVEPEGAVQLATELAANPQLELQGIFTHLPVSELPEGGEFTGQQLASFDQLAAELARAIGPLPLIHAANSGAILTGQLGSTNLVRPGIMAYGCLPDPALLVPGLKPVLQWSTRVLFIKRVLAGQSVGYGRTWVAQRDTWVATVAVGYGDGYSRLLSNRGRMLINGRSYPIAGRVCMDQTMLDLGPGTPSVSVGDEVVLLGSSGQQQITVAEIAELMGTISYEVTCLISSRVERRYLNP